MPDIPSDDYQQGYADGVRDAAAWSAKHAADLVTRSSVLRREAEKLVKAAERIEADARQFEGAAQSRWAQWADRRSWPDVQQLVQASLAGANDRPEAQPGFVHREAETRQTLPLFECTPSLTLAPQEEPASPDENLTDEQAMKRAAGHAWRA